MDACWNLDLLPWIGSEKQKARSDLAATGAFVSYQEVTDLGQAAPVLLRKVRLLS